ncbi:MAG: hypothetical protein M0Q02_07020, partial [Candidatus Muirbacterium halophilum]|nr:hypothetical protein [Candidatus Muirbacterium halophilum]
MKKTVIILLVFLMTNLCFAGEKPCIIDFFNNVQEYLNYMATLKNITISSNVIEFIELGPERWGFEYSRNDNSLIMFDNYEKSKEIKGVFTKSLDISNDELINEFNYTIISNFKETRDELITFRLNKTQIKEELISGFTGTELIISVKLNFDAVLQNHITKSIRFID